MASSFNRIVGDLLCAPLLGRALAIAGRNHFRFHGRVIHAPSPLVRAKTQASLFWRIYESAEVRFIQQYLDRSLDVLDLGASIGAVSCVLRAAMAPERTLVSVEADPVLAELARENLQRNANGAPFTVVNAAIDYTDGGEGEARFARRDMSTSGALLGLQPGDARVLAVPRTTVAAVARLHGFREYALVSDIEGAEAGFISQSPESLEGCRQVIIELHDTVWEGQRWRVEDMIGRLQEGGFTLHAQHGPVCYFARR